jgi:hypothetical protein
MRASIQEGKEVTAKTRFKILTILAILLLIGVTTFDARGENKPSIEVKPTTIRLTETPTKHTDSVIPPNSPIQESPAKAATADQINWQVMSNGGLINGSSTDFLLSGTAGQLAMGAGSAIGFVLKPGFWQDFSLGEGSCCVVPGDANDDGVANIGDAVFIINRVFKGGAAASCPDQADANYDCHVDLGDAVFLVYYTFAENPPPQCGCSE